METQFGKCAEVLLEARVYIYIYIFFFNFIYFIFFFAAVVYLFACLLLLFIIRILVPRPGIKPLPLAVEAQSLNHWISREVFRS